MRPDKRKVRLRQYNSDGECTVEHGSACQGTNKKMSDHPCCWNNLTVVR